MLSSYLSLLILLPTLSFAFSFNFESTPRQCQTLSISITGSGQPPYSVLILPFGPSPLANNTEVRKIFQSNFTGDSTSHSFLLSYPESSQFVAVVSDSTGFGSGGTSGAVAVLSSNDSSCYNVNQGVQPDFFYSLVPNSLTQCAATRIWWDPTAGVQGTPSFQGVIPGGQSFIVPQGSLTTVAEQGLGFNWSPSVRAGTTMVFVASDDRGPGTGGSSTYIVNFGDNGCLNDQSPSSTAGNPAGGSYPTSTSGAGIGNSDTHHTDVGAIVGGVIGGLVGLVSILLIVLFFIRRIASTNPRTAVLSISSTTKKEMESLTATFHSTTAQNLSSFRTPQSHPHMEEIQKLGPPQACVPVSTAVPDILERPLTFYVQTRRTAQLLVVPQRTCANLLRLQASDL
ncbi:hypothetical protein EW026_g8301 [Hermanssonia centrifuga]|uniref:Uncharacterized protein n=1 Tax=Hermanssonia centrifuga TaxID=98765 RepID=A0A4S4K5M8_9APHY|nr:hypothetical protein EW026_g8301 [Hermanssonia centrifuga]